MKYFIKILIIVQLLINSTLLSAQINQNDEVKKVISTFFEGLHQGDTAIIKQTISSNILMQTAFINKEGKSVLRDIDVPNFLNLIASKKTDDIWFEKLLDHKIMIDSNIASVLTPYEFYHNNEFSHCGSNSFQLFNNGDSWKIIYLLDTRKHNNCHK